MSKAGLEEGREVKYSYNINVSWAWRLARVAGKDKDDLGSYVTASRAKN